MFGKQRIHRRYLLQDPQSSSLAKRLMWLAISIIAIAGLSLAAVNIANATPSNSSALEPSKETGRLEFKNSSGKRFDALHLGTDVDMQISGMIATITYQQTFKNTSSDWLEAIYLFPLPSTAAVHGMEMTIGERVIKGEIKEKQHAQKIYQQAKKSGRRASLVEQQRPNMFTQKIANIGPNDEIKIRLSYRQKVDYKFGQFSLRLPLTITPRYIPGAPLLPHEQPDYTPNVNDEKLSNTASNTMSNPMNNTITLGDSGWGWSPATDQVADAHLITPPMISALELSNHTTQSHLASINIELDAGLPLASINSPFHDINIQRQQKRHTVALSNGRTAMDRDFVLQWQAVSNSAPSAALFSEHIGDDEYLMLMLVPPQTPMQNSNPLATKTLPRDVTFIIDTSGSMQGTSIVQAKSSLKMALQTLQPHDQFNIIEFNSSFSRFASSAQQADSASLHRAQYFVEQLHAGGGTEMFEPLQAALNTEKKPNNSDEQQRLEQIIFITDGSVGNEQALFKLIHEQLGNARLFTVAIGSAPNSFFMRKAAQFGRGSFTHIGDSSEVSEKMSTLFAQLQSPVLRDLNIQWPNHETVEMWPQRIPDLYRGQPLLITAKRSAVKGDHSKSAGNITVTGSTLNKPWQKTLNITQPASRSGVASLWARDKIAALLDQKTAGADEAEIKPEVLKVALEHQLISPYTSFIAVEQEVVRPANTAIKQKPVPNLVAKGQKLQAHSYPQSALGINGNLLLGVLALLFAAMLYHQSYRPQVGITQAQNTRG